MDLLKGKTNENINKVLKKEESMQIRRIKQNCAKEKEKNGESKLRINFKKECSGRKS